MRAQKPASEPLLDVLILGGGLAGLAAGSVLLTKAKTFRILEAKDHIGGRAVGLKPKKAVVELGAEFVHEHPKVLNVLKKQMHLQLRKIDPPNFILKRGNISKAEEFWDEIEEVLEKVPKRGRDLPFGDFLRRLRSKYSQEKLKQVRDFVESFHAAEITKLSSAYVREAGVADQSSRLIDGYRSITENFRKKLSRKIRYQQIVWKIEWKKNFVRIWTQNPQNDFEVFTAKKCIVTFPLGVLKARAQENGIEWVPKLPLLKRLRQIEMGYISKVTYRIDRKLWDHLKKQESFLHAPEGWLVYWTLKSKGEFFLISWIGGPAAKRMRAWPDQKVLNYHQKLAKKNFSAKFSAWIYESYFHDWSKDPFCQGAYSYYTPATKKMLPAFREPYLNTIYFAGEAFAEQNSTTFGAIESGFNIAKEIANHEA